MPSVGSAASASASSPLDSKWAMKRSSASSRRLKTRSSVSSRSSSEISRVGRDVVRVDHRQVEPGLDAVVQEDRVEDGARPRRDAEGDVGDAERGLHAGDLGLDPADALDRLDRRGLPLLVAGGQGEGERVEDQRLGVEAVLVAGDARAIRLAISTLRSAVFAIPTSSIVSAISAAPCALASGTTTSALSRPASRLIELTIARPGDLLQRRLDHLGLGRVDLDRRRLGQRDPLRRPRSSARPRPGARSAPRRRRARGRRLRPGLRRPGRGRRSRRRAAAPWPCASPAS